MNVPTQCAVGSYHQVILNQSAQLTGTTQSSVVKNPQAGSEPLGFLKPIEHQSFWDYNQGW